MPWSNHLPNRMAAAPVTVFIVGVMASATPKA